MHGYVKSFYVEPDGTNVVMTVFDPSEGQDVTVLVSKLHLSAMADAEPRYDADSLPQTPTPRQS